MSSQNWLEDLCHAVRAGQCLDLTNPMPWGGGIALALAPHPDDTEAIAVTLRLLAANGWQLRWAIVTSGWSGVRDDFVGPDKAAKAAARKWEQQAAAQLFGLPASCLKFLELEETEDGALAPTSANRERLFARLNQTAPDLVLLPWRLDANASHRLVHEWFAEWAADWPRPVVALGNEDPKTREFQPHLRVVFDEPMARWKEKLLEYHRSQSARNLATRGHTLAARVLTVNRAVPGIPDGHYAERFQVECWRCCKTIASL
jgi:LmbE family N-acetylglucosaminyl deacetylase